MMMMMMMMMPKPTSPLRPRFGSPVSPRPDSPRFDSPKSPRFSFPSDCKSDLPSALQIRFSIVMHNCLTKLKAVAGETIAAVISGWKKFKSNKSVVRATVRCLADWSNLLKINTEPYMIFSDYSKRVEFSSAVGSFVDVNLHYIEEDLKKRCLGLNPCNDDDAKSLIALADNIFVDVGDMALPFMSVPASAGTMIRSLPDLPFGSNASAMFSKPIPSETLFNCDAVVAIADKGPREEDKEEDVNKIVFRCMSSWSKYLIDMTPGDAITLQKLRTHSPPNSHYVRATWLVSWLAKYKQYLIDIDNAKAAKAA
jgi:hypothetical protein